MSQSGKPEPIEGGATPAAHMTRPKPAVLCSPSTSSETGEIMTKRLLKRLNAQQVEPEDVLKVLEASAEAGADRSLESTVILMHRVLPERDADYYVAIMHRMRAVSRLLRSDGDPLAGLVRRGNEPARFDLREDVVRAACACPLVLLTKDEIGFDEQAFRRHCMTSIDPEGQA